MVSYLKLYEHLLGHVGHVGPFFWIEEQLTWECLFCDVAIDRELFLEHLALSDDDLLAHIMPKVTEYAMALVDKLSYAGIRTTGTYLDVSFTRFFQE